MFEPSIDSEQMFGQHVVMQRTYVRRRRVVALAVLVVVMSLPAAAAAMRPGGGQEPATTTYVVRPGDTLWEIAERVGGRRDPREVVTSIARASRVEPGSLEPGQVLIVPVAG
jgi:nucleoid-associated protein YgaU